MHGCTRIDEMKWFTFICLIMFCVALSYVKGDIDLRVEPTKTEDQLKLEEKEKEKEEEKKVKVRKVVSKISPKDIEKLIFPEDTSPVMNAKEVQITGNLVISTEEILSNIPLVYNASSAPLLKASSDDLYDFRTLCDIIDNPGQPREISARTVRGLTQCILGVYRNKGYSGIYVSVPAEAVSGGQLQDDILLINITEAHVASITATYFTPDNNQVEPNKAFLDEAFLMKWTPTKVGEVGKQKQLDDYLNLLNLNPDRYIYATVSKGPEPNSLAVNYNVYEANPWHWFWQLDNAGTDDQQYSPRIGLINTNLFGFDDELIIFHQAHWDNSIFDEYALYGSYDVPVMGPRLRFKVFAAYNTYDVDGGAGINFLGHGYMYGGELKYNVLQKEGWFLDLRSSLSYEESKVTSSMFSSTLGSKVRMLLWGLGVDLHKRTDMADTTISFDRVQSVGGSDQDSFWDDVALTGARTDAEKDFSIYYTSLNHSCYLDYNKVQRLNGSFKWIVPTDRLVPAKMTSFGGMYTVRGYEELGIVADGGILASVQYEFDLVKHGESKDVDKTETEVKPFIRKLAPLVFFDYGWAKYEDKVSGEENEDLYSIGPGLITELGDHFMGAVYYGIPLRTTETNDYSYKGALNFSLMVRW